MQNTEKKYFLIAFLVFAAFGFFQIFGGEKLPVANGLGWDGVKYAEMTRNFESLFLNHGISAYYLQRTLPCALVHYSFRLLSVDFIDEHIILGFELLNFILLLVGFLVWRKVLQEANFSGRQRILSTIFLFVTYPVLKQNFYYPVLTDTCCLFLSICLLLFYTRKNKIGILLTIIAGCFTWPSFIYFAAPLFVFLSNDEKRIKIKGWFYYVIPALITSGFLAAVIFVFFIRHFEMDIMGNPFNRDLIWISIGAALFHCFAGFKGFLSNSKIFRIRNYFNKNILISAVVILVLWIGVKVFNDVFKGENFNVGARELIRGIAMRSVINPFISLNAHIIYFGPVILLLLLFFRRFVAELKKENIGLTIFFLFMMFFSLNSETRGLINTLPFIVFFLVRMLHEDELKNEVLFIISILALIYSKIWLPINVAAFTSNPLQYPDQRYFLNHGPWITNSSYYFEIAFNFCMLLLLILYFRMQKRRRLTGVFAK